MKPWRLIVVLLGALLMLTACTAQPTPSAPPAALTETAEAAPQLYSNEMAVSAMQKGGCGACHIIPGVPGAVS